MAARLTTFIVVCIVAATFVVGIITRAQRAEQGPVDLIVLNGKVYGGDGETFAEAVAVRTGKIVVVGSNREVKRLQRPQTTVVDAHGGTVVPGFNDAHARFLDSARLAEDADLGPLRSREQLAERLRARAADGTGAAWVAGRTESLAVLAAHVRSCRELERVTPGRPTVIESADGLLAWANCSALAAAHISKTTAEPGAGTIVKGAGGTPTGVLKDAAVDLMRAARAVASRSDAADVLRAGIADAHRFGVTSVLTAGTPAELAAWSDLRDRGELTLRAYHAFALGEETSDAALDGLDTLRRQYGDDPLFKTGAVEIDARAAGGELTSLVARLDARGWQVWVRATEPDDAVRALDALETAGRVNPAPPHGRRHRLDYAGPLDADTRARLGALGVLSAFQPSQHRGLAAVTAAPWHAAASPRTPFAFGSGWPSPGLHPMVTLAAALVGPTPASEDAAPAATISRAAAIDALTSAGAYASFDEQRKGRLSPGQLADLVILSGDLFDAPIEHLADVQVDTTIFSGRVVFTRDAR